MCLPPQRLLSGQSPSLPYIYPRCCIIFCNESRNITSQRISLLLSLVCGVFICIYAQKWWILPCFEQLAAKKCSQLNVSRGISMLRRQRCGMTHLVGGLEHLKFPFHIWVVILPIGELIFFRGVGQPPTSTLDSWPFFGTRTYDFNWAVSFGDPPEFTSAKNCAALLKGPDDSWHF